MGMYWILLVEAVHQHAKNGKLTDGCLVIVNSEALKQVGRVCH